MARGQYNCNTNKGQSCDHLFRECKGWARVIKTLRKRVNTKCTGVETNQKQEETARVRPRNTAMLGDERFTEVIPEFLKETRIGYVKEGVPKKDKNVFSGSQCFIFLFFSSSFFLPFLLFLIPSQLLLIGDRLKGSFGVIVSLTWI